MKRLTKNMDTQYDFIGSYDTNIEEFANNKKLRIDVMNKLGALEDIEEEIGIDLITLFKAIENGFYYINNGNKISFCRWCIRVGKRLVEVKPCYAVKETTIHSCYYGDVSELKQMNDAHYWDWGSSLYVELKDYGKTWSLDKRELENEKDLFKN